MTKLKIYILLFFFALALPLGYLVARTYQGMDREETAELRFFAESLFDSMEEELAALVRAEEARQVDDYQAGSQKGPDKNFSTAPYILGYFQNNPDGSFFAPQAQFTGPEEQRRLEPRLAAANIRFNQKRMKGDLPAPAPLPVSAAAAAVEEDLEQMQEFFSGRYLSQTKKEKKQHLGGQQKMVIQSITPDQADALTQAPFASQPEKASAPLMAANKDYPSSTLQKSRRGEGFAQEAMEAERAPEPDEEIAPLLPDSPAPAAQPLAEASTSESKTTTHRAQPPLRQLSDIFVEQDSAAPAGSGAFQMSMYFGEETDPNLLKTPTDDLRVEVAPMQSVLINDGLVFLFRRVILGNRVFRQGVLIRVNELLRHLMDTRFAGQPMARFSNLTLYVADGARKTVSASQGPAVLSPRLTMNRDFPRPFSFLHGSLEAENLPPGPARQTLNTVVLALLAVVVLGLLAIYSSARAVMVYSKRRSDFVSSVTHELKTPLTTIRMYVEMLGAGMAKDTEREQEYLETVGQETVRLSRLIDNVLEFAKLEKKNRPMNMTSGDLSEVLATVRDLALPKLTRAGFDLELDPEPVGLFSYDPEAMVQIFLNLLENSMKFGQGSKEKNLKIALKKGQDTVCIAVSDTGPGIPKQAIKKVFNDFYRSNDPLTQSTGGAGIGLALVKKLVLAMGGTVRASNNPHAGCTIFLHLPAKSPGSKSPPPS